MTVVGLSGHAALVNVARNCVRSARTAGRWAFAGGRPLPDFVILGAQRCGTTSLFENLGTHPQIVKPIGKELQFFTTQYRLGERWYRSQFPKLTPGQQTLEATPYYLYHPDAPMRAASMLPDAKFIVMLRDPVARAFSHYLHTRNLGIEKLGFDEALAAEPDRLARARHLGVNTRSGRHLHQNFSYVSRGLYAEQLQRWLDWVPLSRIKVVRSEDFYRRPDAVLEDVLAYLGLSAHHPQHYTRSNVQTYGGSAVQMSSATKDWLSGQFEDETKKLARMLGCSQLWS